MIGKICLAMYNIITKPRPEWHGNDDGKGKVEIVMPARLLTILKGYCPGYVADRF